MNFLVVFTLVVVVFVGYAATGPLTPNWCSSCDDPHISTFDNTNYEFHEFGQHYILYTNLKDVHVTTGFMPCMFDSSLSCNCAIYVRFQDTLLFMDVCGVQIDSDHPPGFYYTIKGDGHIYDASCDSKLMGPEDETNDMWWNKRSNAKNINNRISCAKMEDMDTYVIRTNGRNPNENVFVRVLTHTLGISNVYVRPSISSYNRTGGLCGRWNDDPEDDLYILNKRNRPQVLTDQCDDESTLVRLGLFWRLTRDVPRIQQYREFDEELYCPCDQDYYDEGHEDDNDEQDNMPSWMKNSLGGKYCKKMVSVCAMATSVSDIALKETVRNKRAVKIERDEAIETCRKTVLDEDITAARDLKMVNVDQILDICVKDYMETGDIYWSYTHNNWARNDAIRNIKQTKSQIEKESFLKNANGEAPDARLESLDNKTLMAGLKRPLETRIKDFKKVLAQGQIQPLRRK